MTEYAYAYSMQGPWTGSFESRPLAEEAARDARQPGQPERFVMVWTAEILTLTVGDLVRGGHLLPWLDDRSNYQLSKVTYDLTKDEEKELEDAVGTLIDEWGSRHGYDLEVLRHVAIEPGFYNIDYASAKAALKGGAKRYQADGPVDSEMHYMTLVGRIARFIRQKKRADLQGVSLDVRSENMTQAMLRWDAEFPLPGMQRYEVRVREIKNVLRSPWPPLGVFKRDENGHTDYFSLTDEEESHRKHYLLLQRELQWLKRRLTEIYRAREWARAERRKARNPSASEIPPSTGAVSL